MKKALLTLTIALMASGQVVADDRFWDSDGGANVGGSAGTMANGTWGTSNFWNTDSSGGAGTFTTTVGAANRAVFSAGGDVTGESEVTIGSSQTVAGMLIEEGILDLDALAPNTINVGAGTVEVQTGATLAVDNVSGNFEITHTAGGKLLLNGGTLRFDGGNGNTAYSTNAAIEATANGSFLNSPTNLIGGVFQGTMTGTGGTTANGGMQTFTKIGAGEWRVQGANQANNTFSKLVVNQGVYRIANVSGNNHETGFGAAPTAPLADAITLNGGSIGTSFAVTTHVNRGITVAAGGGTINTTSGSFTVAGGMSGPGALTLIGTGLVFTSNGSVGTILGASTTTVTVTGAAIVLSAGDTSNFTFNGLVAGTGQFRKTGTGIMTMSDKNWTNTGGVTVDAGTLKFGNSAASLANTVPVTINNSAILDMNSINDTFGSLVSTSGNTTGELKLTGNLTLGQTATAARNYFGTITGGGTLTKGGGTWTQTLSGNNTYTGATTVNAGTLLMNGSNTSNVTVVGGTYGGTGSTSGTVTVQTGGTLSPGASVESFAGGATSFQSGSTFLYELQTNLAAAAGADLLDVNGALNIATNVTLSLVDLASGFQPSNTKYTMISYDSWNGGTFTGFADDLHFNFADKRWIINYNDTTAGLNFPADATVAPGGGFVTLTVVPEASSIVAMGLTGIFAAAAVWVGKRRGIAVLNI